ncbi:hypothetical protein MESS2_600014 [Mesorhizobium metallidurans STM 2683]|uniref:Uncharacterized protein n=1 Tax=Mesorhizobium metallidurans STM 2683 TaxID=1297569 RepID=M5EUG1_9HYPH|nr:hypothetical protein MESS2_600014 [Mesorhizobium metallidurans STM 2683]
MENDDAARRQMGLQFGQCDRRIRHELQDVAASNCVDGLRQAYLRGITHIERHIVQSERGDPTPGDVERRGGSIHSDNPSRRADQIGKQDGDIASSRTDVEHTHPGSNSRLHEKPSRDRVNQACLGTEALQLQLGMAERIWHFADCVGTAHHNLSSVGMKTLTAPDAVNQRWSEVLAHRDSHTEGDNGASPQFHLHANVSGSTQTETNGRFREIPPIHAWRI